MQLSKIGTLLELIGTILSISGLLGEERLKKLELKIRNAFVLLVNPVWFFEAWNKLAKTLDYGGILYLIVGGAIAFALIFAGLALGIKLLNLAIVWVKGNPFSPVIIGILIIWLWGYSELTNSTDNRLWLKRLETSKGIGRFFLMVVFAPAYLMIIGQGYIWVVFMSLVWLLLVLSVGVVLGILVVILYLAGIPYKIAERLALKFRLSSPIALLGIAITLIGLSFQLL